MRSLYQPAKNQENNQEQSQQRRSIYVGSPSRSSNHDSKQEVESSNLGNDNTAMQEKTFRYIKYLKDQNVQLKQQLDKERQISSNKNSNDSSVPRNGNDQLTQLQVYQLQVQCASLQNEFERYKTQNENQYRERLNQIENLLREKQNYIAQQEKLCNSNKLLSEQIIDLEKKTNESPPKERKIQLEKESKGLKEKCAQIKKEIKDIRSKRDEAISENNKLRKYFLQLQNENKKLKNLQQQNQNTRKSSPVIRTNPKKNPTSKFDVQKETNSLANDNIKQKKENNNLSQAQKRSTSPKSTTATGENSVQVKKRSVSPKSDASTQIKKSSAAPKSGIQTRETSAQSRKRNGGSKSATSAQESASQAKKRTASPRNEALQNKKSPTSPKNGAQTKETSAQIRKRSTSPKSAKANSQNETDDNFITLTMDPESILDLQTKIKVLTQQIKDKSDTVDKLKAKNSEAKKNYEKLKKENTELNTKFNSYLDDLNLCSATIVRQKNDLDDKDKQIDALQLKQSKIKKLIKVVSNIKDTNIILHERNRELQQKMIEASQPSSISVISINQESNNASYPPQMDDLLNDLN